MFETSGAKHAPILLVGATVRRPVEMGNRDGMDSHQGTRQFLKRRHRLREDILSGANVEPRDRGKDELRRTPSAVMENRRSHTVNVVNFGDAVDNGTVALNLVGNLVAGAGPFRHETSEGHGGLLDKPGLADLANTGKVRTQLRPKEDFGYSNACTGIKSPRETQPVQGKRRGLVSGSAKQLSLTTPTFVADLARAGIRAPRRAQRRWTGLTRSHVGPPVNFGCPGWRGGTGGEDQRLLGTHGGVAPGPCDQFDCRPPTSAEIVKRRKGRVFWKAAGDEDGIVTSGERHASARGPKEDPLAAPTSQEEPRLPATGSEV